jgi:hypothetical protein
MFMLAKLLIHLAVAVVVAVQILSAFRLNKILEDMFPL